MTLKELKQLQEAVEKHQSCLHCGKQGHHHTNCLRKFVQNAKGKHLGVATNM